MTQGVELVLLPVYFFWLIVICVYFVYMKLQSNKDWLMFFIINAKSLGGERSEQ